MSLLLNNNLSVIFSLRFIENMIVIFVKSEHDHSEIVNV